MCVCVCVYLYGICAGIYIYVYMYTRMKANKIVINIKCLRRPRKRLHSHICAGTWKQ